jgi:REP element-mobilizing transposase RayT
MSRFHGNSLRIGRYSEPGRPYLLTANTIERRPFFSDFWVGRLVVHELKRATELECVESLAWVVMPDHMHWLAVLRGASLAQMMHRVKSTSAVKINRHLARTGPVWQKGYHDRALRRDEHVRDVARYIVANPLRAGLVQKLNDYPLWDAIWV